MEFIGTVEFSENGKRGNPVALYVQQQDGEYRISSRLPQWTHIVGTGATVNKAAGDYELRLKAAAPTAVYDGPAWNAGIKAEKPASPKPPAAAAPMKTASEGSPPAPPPQETPPSSQTPSSS